MKQRLYILLQPVNSVMRLQLFRETLNFRNYITIPIQAAVPSHGSVAGF